MTIANLYRKLKQILHDSNIALIDKGLNSVDSLSNIIDELEKNEINRLPYLIGQNIIELNENDFNGVLNIGESAFSNYTSLESVIIGNSVIEIGAYAFNHCTNLKSVTFGNNVIRIGSAAFASCEFENVTIGNSVIEIGASAFSGCTKLKSVTIGSNMKKIQTQAFYKCRSLESIIIPKSVNLIAPSAFEFCDNLSDIYLNPTIPPTLSDKHAIPYKTIIHVPIGSGESYKSATNWSYHSSNIIEDI